MKLSKWTFSTICVTEKNKIYYSYANYHSFHTIQNGIFLCIKSLHVLSILKSFKPTIIDGFVYK